MKMRELGCLEQLPWRMLSPSQEDSRIVRRDDDRRLIRLAKSRMNSRGDIIIADHKRIRLPDDTVKKKTDSENEMTGLVLVKPVFVSMSENGTIAERERLEARKRAHEEITEKRMEERKLETKSILAQEIWKDEQVQKNIELREANFADIDTDEEVKKEEELEAWMARVIARIKRDKEEPGAMSKRKEETEKVRNTAEEEEMENVKLELPRKKRWRFMQKYQHKGVFFQSGADDHASTTVVGKDEIYKRDFSDPTGEDKMDKTILPKVMQVKHFGHRGRTKWTHLANEDTTDLSNL
ncbi:hypothetical protein C3L33_22524, partial [Rhododendron williamsianum]